MKGNTADLLEAVLAGARSKGAQTERLNLAEMEFSPCLECAGCGPDDMCIMADDDMREIYSRIRAVDAIALASPIFFMGVTAQTKAMIDRCQNYWVERFVHKKRAYVGRRRPKGLFVSCAGSQRPIVFEPALHIVKSFFSAIDYEYVGEVLLANTDDPALAPRKNVALEKARIEGAKLCE